MFKTQIVYLKNTKHPQGLSSAAYIKYRAGHLYFRFEVHTTEWGRTILCVCGDFSALVTTEVYIHHMFDHWRIHMRNLLWGMIDIYSVIDSFNVIELLVNPHISESAAILAEWDGGLLVCSLLISSMFT